MALRAFLSRFLENFFQTTNVFPQNGLWYGHYHGFHAALQPFTTIFHPVNGFGQIIQDSVAIGFLSFGYSSVQQFPGGLYHREVNQVSIKSTIVVPAIGIG